MKLVVQVLRKCLGLAELAQRFSASFTVHLKTTPVIRNAANTNTPPVSLGASSADPQQANQEKCRTQECLCIKLLDCCSKQATTRRHHLFRKTDRRISRAFLTPAGQKVRLPPARIRKIFFFLTSITQFSRRARPPLRTRSEAAQDASGYWAVFHTHPQSGSAETGSLNFG